MLLVIISIAVYSDQWSYDGQYSENALWMLTLIAAFGFGGWFTLYLWTPPQIESVETLTAYTVDGTDMINDAGKLVNLNEKYGKRIEEGTQVEATHYKQHFWTSVGVYCVDSSYDTVYKLKANDSDS